MRPTVASIVLNESPFGLIFAKFIVTAAAWQAGRPPYVTNDAGSQRRGGGGGGGMPLTHSITLSLATVSFRHEHIPLICQFNLYIA